LGDKITARQVVAQTQLPGNVQSVNAAGMLSIPPEEVPGALTVKVGDAITKGQILGVSKSFFGLFKTNCESPIDGILENASPVTGQLILREPPIPVEVHAYIDGKVIELFPEEGVVVEAFGSLIQGIFGIGGERHGIIRMLVKSPDEVVDEAKISGDVAGKILIGGSLITLPAFRKAMTMGATAVVVGGFNNSDLKALLGYEQGVAITGHEDIASTLVLTEGFGKIAMAQRTFDLLRESDGKGASVSGATQIRAGVIRPEVIIPNPSVTSVPEQSTEVASIEIGDFVRIIRQPYFGKIGKVTLLPSELQQLETGAKVRVLELELDDTKRVILPRANIERIEE